MRVLVCGGREFDDWRKLSRELGDTLDHNHKTGYNDNVIIQGGAKGADFLARVWAKWMGIECVEFPADWKRYGPSAGHRRNSQMLHEGLPDLVVAFPGGRGTQNMINQAKQFGVKVKVIT